MVISVNVDRPIHGEANSAGRLEIIEDVGVDPDHHHLLLSAFTVPTFFILMSHHVMVLWEMIKQHTEGRIDVLFLCPGNGAWLIERALKSHGIELSFVQPVEVSRDGTSNIQIQGNPNRIVIIEDIVETGGTAAKLRTGLGSAKCPIILATMLWHDRASQTDQVLKVFDDYDRVLVPVRIRSNHKLDDIRSLSTLARKHEKIINHRYSMGREQSFSTAMSKVLDLHPWLRQLGIDLGYRKDEHSISTFGSKT